MFRRPFFHRPLLLVAVPVLLAGAGPVLPDAARASEPEGEPPPPCTAPECRQLDFWVGTWDLTWEGGRGTNVIERAYDDCVIVERFEGDELRGMSVSTWDAKAGTWRQTWVDNQGSYLDFTGGVVGDRVVLERETTVEGRPVRQRMVFHDIEADSLKWDWESSRDDGETWKRLWRIEYRRRT
jgi:hypothetical protein